MTTTTELATLPALTAATGSPRIGYDLKGVRLDEPKQHTRLDLREVGGTHPRALHIAARAGRIEGYTPEQGKPLSEGAVGQGVGENSVRPQQSKRVGLCVRADADRSGGEGGVPGRFLKRSVTEYEALQKDIKRLKAKTDDRS